MRYIREDGSPAVEPVKKNEMLGTFTDAEGKQVFEKGASPTGGTGAVDLGPANLLLAQVLKGVNDIKKAFGIS